MITYLLVERRFWRKNLGSMIVFEKGPDICLRRFLCRSDVKVEMWWMGRSLAADKLKLVGARIKM